MKYSSANKDLIDQGKHWFKDKAWKPFDFQIDTWEAYLENRSGLLNAPTGSGKTFALWVPFLLESLKSNPTSGKRNLKLLWVTPLRALAKDIHHAMISFAMQSGVSIQVGLRYGDTTTGERDRQKKNPPDALVITPESLHVLLSQTDYPYYFKELSAIIVDEWHELIGTKRGVATELAISRLKALTIKPLKIWGISATIGNLKQAKRVLLGEDFYKNGVEIVADIDKPIKVESILPDEIENYPWSGHLGTRLIDKVIPIIQNSGTTLLFTNTRSQTELWYQAILKNYPEMAGLIAMHHGSMDQAIRNWVEDAIHDGKLKCVVCTSSLDLGVDFRPVDVVIQVGGPKGVSRFQQRAGRSGHAPGELSQIYFLPTHALELVEGAALRKAIDDEKFESRKPLEKSLDVLVQYLVTLAVGGGFKALKILEEVKSTFAFRLLTANEWNWMLDFITTGGNSLGAYDEFAKVYSDDGVYKILNRRAATRHRLSIGTIVGEPSLKVRFTTGGYLGTVEEYFVSKLNPGDTFWFAGRNLEFVRLKDLTVQVKKSKRKSGLTPAWAGGRFPLSSMLSDVIKEKLQEAKSGNYEDVELQAIRPLLEIQERWSTIPDSRSLLIEKTATKYGHHVFIYPFEGMFVHEVLSGLIAYRISKITRISFSISMNDYGFELLSDQEIPIEEALELDIFTEDNLMEDISQSVNKTEMARRKFRDVATIAGLVFQGYPGKPAGAKHLQANSSILFKVFEEYDEDNLLVKQSVDEVMTQQLEQSRLFEAIRRINKQKIILRETHQPTPFAYPILVASLRRENLSSEEIEDRLQKMQMRIS